MLTMVEAFSPQGETLALPLEDTLNGYIVKGIDGLDPVKATIVTTSFAQLDGSQYQSSRREPRDIILRVGIEPDYFANSSVQELRSRLYAFFMPKSHVTLRFYVNDEYFVHISGRVESLEAPLFSKEPEAIITLLCFDPDFVAASSVVVPGTTVSNDAELAVPYPGTIETGVTFTLEVDRELSSFMIYGRPLGGDYQAFEFAAPLLAGDILEISTVAGNKGAWVTRNGSRSSIVYGISPTSTWVKLYPGENMVRISTEGVPIPYTMEYTAKYGGL